MQVVITEMEELSGASTRSSESTLPVSVFQPKLLSRTRTRTQTFGQAVLAIARIGTSTGGGKDAMDEELDGTHVHYPICHLSNVTQLRDEREPSTDWKLRQSTYLWL